VCSSDLELDSRGARQAGSQAGGEPGRRLSEANVSAIRQAYPMVTIDEVRAFASHLPRAYEALVRDRVKFRVGRIVFLAFSRDEQIMGFGFPKEEREALVAAEPGKFLMPGQADLRYHWVHVRLAAIDLAEMRELVLDAWRMCVPKGVATTYLEQIGRSAGQSL